MAIVNRDLDPSQQKNIINIVQGLTVTGQTLTVAIVPFPATLKAISFAAMGISGSPTVNLEIHRMTSGGFTQISGGMTQALTLQAVGTSGPQAAVIGPTFTALSANDVLVIKSGGANSAVNSFAAAIVISATQDILSVLGSTT